MKEKIRKSMLQRREAHDDIEDKSMQIKKALFSSEKYRNAGTILFYMSIRSEVDTREMIEEAVKEKKIALPVTDTENNELKISLVENMDRMKKGAYGVSEPVDIMEINQEKVDLVIVPGIAFDRTGGRVGYGKGYYDKLLKNMDIPKIALAFSFQVIEKIPAESHDIKVDKIITEKGVIECS